MCHTIPVAERKRFSVDIPSEPDGAEALASLLAATADFARATGLPSTTEARLAIIIEELASNAIRHGGAGTVTLSLSLTAGHIDIAFEDTGAPFDASQNSTFAGPDLETGGGVGLQLVRSWCDVLGYRRDENRNLLTAQLRCR